MRNKRENVVDRGLLGGYAIGIKNLMFMTCSKRGMVEIWMDFFFLFRDTVICSRVLDGSEPEVPKNLRINILINKTGQTYRASDFLTPQREVSDHV